LQARQRQIPSELEAAASANLAHDLLAPARRHAGRTAIKQDATEISHEALNVVTARVAGLLRERGARPGDRIGMTLPNVAQLAVAYYGALRAGAVVVPMDVLFDRREVAYHLADADICLVFAWHELPDAVEDGAADAGADCVIVRPHGFAQLLADAAAVRDIAGRAGSDTAALLYTPDSTGLPRRAEHTHADLTRNAKLARETLGLDESSVTLGMLPLFHSFGQTSALNATIAAGGCVTLLPRFDAGKALELIQRDRVTVLDGSPSMYAALLQHPERDRFDTSSIRVCAAGGAALPAELMRDVEHAFGCAVAEGYGLPETEATDGFRKNVVHEPPRPATGTIEILRPAGAGA
jgi:long-chain acyl-CoA synthetase